MHAEFTFTLIMACYNVESYIAEAIESVVQQSIGFEKHIELILVNDGSPDNLESIALHYQNRYPQNIVYIKQENQGPGAARNAGLDYGPRGKFVNFLDPDDKLDKNCLAEVYRAFAKQASKNTQAHAEQVASNTQPRAEQVASEAPEKPLAKPVQIAVVPMRFFDAKEGLHPLNIATDSEVRVVDLQKEYHRAVRSVANVFFEASALHEVRFHQNLRHSEDTLFVSQVLQHTMQVLSVGTTWYWYRQRDNKVGVPADTHMPADTVVAPNTQEMFDMVHEVYSPIFTYFKKRGETVPPYFQHLALYDLWQYFSKPHHTEPLTAWIEQVQRLLQSVQPEVIETFDLYYPEEISWFSVLRQSHRVCLLRYVSSHHNQVNIEGEIIGEVSELFFQSGTDRKPVAITKAPVLPHASLFATLLPTYTFQLRIAIDDLIQSGQFLIKTESGTPKVLYEAGKFSRFIPCQDGYMGRLSNRIIYFSQGVFSEGPRGISSWYRRERSVLLRLYGVSHGFLKSSFLTRLCYRRLKPFKPKHVWLFSDTTHRAGDNAEALFRYVVEEKRVGNPALKQVKPIFIIRKNTRDYHKLKKVGKVVALGSPLHMYYFLFAQYQICSSADVAILEPLKPEELDFRDIPQPKRIFLQQGVMQGGMFDTLCRSKVNFSLITTAGESEYQRFLQPAYGYTTQEIKLTGFAKYDLLIPGQAPERYILVAPSLCALQQPAHLDKWNNLLSYPELHTMLRAHGFTMRVLLPNETEKGATKETVKGAMAFDYALALTPGLVELIAIDNSVVGNFSATAHSSTTGDLADNGPLDGSPSVDSTSWADGSPIGASLANTHSFVLQQAAMVITDYDSLAFDAAYMEKPVVYYHIDGRPDASVGASADDFRDAPIGTQIESLVDGSGAGQFYDPQELFGEVCTSEQMAVDTLSAYVERGWPITPLAVYKQRAEEFFAFRDQLNRSRILKEILALEEG